jgi:hypothetical protein
MIPATKILANPRPVRHHPCLVPEVREVNCREPKQFKLS